LLGKDDESKEKKGSITKGGKGQDFPKKGDVMIITSERKSLPKAWVGLTREGINRNIHKGKREAF